MDEQKEKDVKTTPVKETPKEDKKEKKKNEADKLREELASQKELLLRTAAEYDNYRKRSERERQGSVEFGKATALEALLATLDNLERAAGANSTDAEYKKGVEMTLRMFTDALNGLGVSEIEALGLPFNPDVHAAAAQLAAEGAQSGQVTAVLQKGYKLGTRVLRHAMVAVAP